VFIRCINKQLESGGNGFSSKCPWKSIVPMMRSGIEMTMAFTGGGDLGAGMPKKKKPRSVIEKHSSSKGAHKRSHSEL
jgi:hypothetical protein